MSGASNDAKVPLAAFDADGTLWDGDAAEIFMGWMKTTNRWSHHGDFVQRCVNLPFPEFSAHLRSTIRVA